MYEPTHHKPTTKPAEVDTSVRAGAEPAAAPAAPALPRCWALMDGTTEKKCWRWQGHYGACHPYWGDDPA